MMSFLPAILILAGAVIFTMTYWPTGVTLDQDNNINLGVVIGKGHKIPTNEITITEDVLYVVDDWRTNIK